MVDSRNISDLHPALQRAAQELIRRMANKGYPVAISSTYRDSEYQDYLYAQGRTAAGSIVTNAKGGQSMHNYRLAFDIFKNMKGQEWSDSKFFDIAGQIGMELGLVWGGSFRTIVDKPHFEYTAGLTLSQLQVGKIVPETARLPWEPAIVVKEPTVRFSLMDYEVFDVPGEIKDGRTYVQARALLEAMGYIVGWDESRKTVLIDVN